MLRSLVPSVRLLVLIKIPCRFMATKPHKGTEAVEFRIDADKAVQVYQAWCETNTPFPKAPAVQSLKAYFLPFWAFYSRVNFSAGGAKQTAHISGPSMQVYSGQMLPRSMTEVLKNKPSDAQLFRGSMLDVRGITVDIEPFEIYEATAWQIARSQTLSHLAELHNVPSIDRPVFNDVISRRILMPTFIIEYKHLGVSFRVFINGATGQAYGIQQRGVFPALSKLFNKVGEVIPSASNPFWKLLSSREGGFILLLIGRMLQPLAKLLLFPPFLLAAAVSVGGYTLFKKTAALREQRASYAEWQEIHAAERAAQAAMTDDWVFRPLGRSESDREHERAFENNTTNTKASFYPRKPAGGAEKTAERRIKPPPVNPEDYYDVLGLKALGPRATLEDIQNAFRRELMRYHPDHQQGTGMDLNAAHERTQQIIKAYGVLRNKDKRAAYDKTYRF